jgi:hypothetical protein
MVGGVVDGFAQQTMPTSFDGMHFMCKVALSCMDFSNRGKYPFVVKKKKRKEIIYI